MRASGRAPSRWRSAALLAVSLGLIAGCAPADRIPGPSTIVLASTTSVQDSGLLDVLVRAFEQAHPGYRVKVIAVGSGEALALGRRKDADVLIAHARGEEERFVADGHGLERRDLMRNDYLLLGPPDDPAAVRRARDMTEALRAIARHGALFISRGDGSGTHTRELALWRTAGVATPTPATAPWYESAGQGMGEVLTIAAEKRAYTLADSATYRAMRRTLDLEVVRSGDRSLVNEYGVVLVSGSPDPKGARTFFEWVTSAQALDLIGSFGVDEFGEPLFVPIAREAASPGTR